MFGVAIIIVRNGICDPSSNSEVVCILFHTDAHVKDLNPTILLPFVGK